MVLIASLLLTSTASAESHFFTDSFKEGLQSGWEWVREVPEEWRTTSEGLEVLSNNGHLYKHRGTPSSNILVRPIDTDATSTIDISVNAQITTNSSIQGGLIIYNDDDNYIKLVIEKITPPSTTHLVMLREHKGKVNHFHHELRDDPGDDEIKVSIGAGTDDTYEFNLRLVIENSRVTMYWGFPGTTTWNKINESMPLPDAHGQWYAGILTSGGAVPQSWQRYRNFTLWSGVIDTLTNTATEGCTLNVDGNRGADALTDGLLFIRHMFGLRDKALISSSLANDCSRCTVLEINTFLDQCASLGISDIDGNGQIKALTDGLLILRFLFGIRGNNLIDNSVANDCIRCTADEIENYLQQLRSEDLITSGSLT